MVASLFCEYMTVATRLGRAARGVVFELHRIPRRRKSEVEFQCGDVGGNLEVRRRREVGAWRQGQMKWDGE